MWMNAAMAEIVQKCWSMNAKQAAQSMVVLQLNEGRIDYRTSIDITVTAEEKTYHVSSTPRQTTLFEPTAHDKHLCAGECIAVMPSSPRRRGGVSP